MGEEEKIVLKSKLDYDIGLVFFEGQPFSGVCVDYFTGAGGTTYTDEKNIGIWVGERKNSMKIAAIGIRVKKWVAYHGFSLNISNDLSKYKKIIPCGIRNKGVTSLKEMGIKNFNNIDKIIVKKFLNTFL